MTESGDKGAILITGIGKRLGLALAQALLADGYRVIGSYRRETVALEALRAAGAELIECDFDQPEQLAALQQQVIANHSSLRALIHNASDWLPDNAPDGHARIMERMMQVHVSVPYQLNLALSPLLEACDDGGDIIHITDYVATRGSSKHIAYAASKAALSNMTLSFAAKLAPQIKVNEIAPALLKFNEGDDDSYKARALKKALIPREGGFEEVIDTVQWLMNSNYVTGRTLHLDGGRHLR